MMTDCEKRFLRIYRRTADPAEALLASGLDIPDGDSPEKAGKAMLRRLKKRLAELESREAVLELATPERVRAEIAHMAFDDIGRYLRFYEGDKGFEVHARCSDEIDTRNISEVSVGTGGKVTLKLYSRERALLKLWDILRQEDSEPDTSLLDALRGLHDPAAEVDDQEGAVILAAQGERKQKPRFASFSPKQKRVLTWWTGPDCDRYDVVICDGAVRSGKTTAVAVSFILWAMESYQDTSFAICGKTVGACSRNVV